MQEILKNFNNSRLSRRCSNRRLALANAENPDGAKPQRVRNDKLFYY